MDKNMQQNPQVICFGEALWDCLPTGRVPGGAPMNVSIHLQALGIPAGLITGFGADELGNELRILLQKKGVDQSLLQTHSEWQTGQVQVELDQAGDASYTIAHPVAWDGVAFVEAMQEAVQKADMFLFGSLGARNPISRATQFQLMEAAQFKICDANLRPPFVDPDLMTQLMQGADLIKVNEEEMNWLVDQHGWSGKSLADRMQALMDWSEAQIVCVTRGERGAALLAEGEIHANPGYRVEVVDTVGAGDSFLATLIEGMLTGKDHAESLDRACAVGAFVASRPGATPDLDLETIHAMRY